MSVLKTSISHSASHNSLYVFIGFFSIALLIYIVVFFLHLSKKNITNKFKDIYNQLQNYNKNINFKPIQIYTKTNPNVKKFYQILIEQKEQLNSMLNICHEDIASLTNANRKLELLNEKKLQKKVSADLVFVTKIKESIENAHKSFMNFDNNLGNIYVDNAQLCDLITVFYEMNIIKKHPNKLCNDLIGRIRKQLAELNCIKNNSFDQKEFTDKLVLLHKSLKSLIDVIISIYKYDKILQHLKNTFEEINAMNFKEYGVKGREINEIKKQLLIGEAQIKKMDAAMEKLDLSDLESCAIIGSRTLEQTLNKIIFNQKINNVITTDLPTLDTIIDSINKKSNEFNSLLSSIDNNIGRKENKIKALIDDCRIKMRKIIKTHELLQINIHDQSMPNDQISENIISIVDACIEWTENIQQMNDEIATKYKKFINIKNQISIDKNIISQLISMKNKYDSSNNTLEDVLNNLFEKVDNIDASLCIDYEKNYDESIKELKNIRENLKSYSQDCLNKKTLLVYSERLFMFLNKYRREHKEIATNLDKAEIFMKEKEIINTIDQLLYVAETMKNEGKSYGYKLE